MSQTDPAAAQPPVPPTSAAAPTPPGGKPPRRRRRWVRWLLVVAVLLVVGLGLLVALAPTLVGLSPIKNAILAQVNKRLNGRVEVATLSVGWTSGVHMGGVKVFDAADRQIASIDKADVPLPLLSAIRKKYPLGETVLDGVNFDARQDAAGQWNFAGLVKAEAKSGPTQPAPAKSEPAAKSEPSKLPEVSGDVKITRCTGTVTRPNEPVVNLMKLDAEVKIPDLNSPINDQLTADVKVGDGTPGHVAAAGTIAAVKGGLVDLDTANVHQTLDLTGLDAAAANAFLSPTGGVRQVAGVLGLHLSADVTDGKAGTAVLTVDGKDVSATGPALKGDTYKTATLAVASHLAFQAPAGLSHSESIHLSTGDQPTTVKVDQAGVTLTADVPVQAVLNVLANKPPGQAGKVQLTTDADVGKIAAAVPDVVRVQKGVEVTGGTVKQTLTVTMDPTATQIAGGLDLAGVTGTRSVDGGPAKPIKLCDVHATFAATDLGGTGNNKVPELRNLSAGLQSDFATGELKATTLADLNGKLTADLAKLLDEGSQFVDTNGLKLAGTLTASVQDTGDLTGGARQADVKANAAFRGLVYEPKDGKRIDESALDLGLVATLHGTEKDTVDSATGVKATVTAGDPAAPTVSVLAQVPSVKLTGDLAADYTATVKADLAKAQKEFAAVSAGKAGAVASSGTLDLTSAGKVAGTHIELTSLDVTGQHLTVAQQLPNGQRVPALSDDTLTVKVAATVDRHPTAADAKKFDTAVVVHTLAVSDTAGLIKLDKAGAGDLTVTQHAAGGFAGGGQLSLAVDLAAVNRVRTALGRTEVAVQTPAGDLKSGHLAGTVTLAAATGGTLTVDADLKATDLVVATPTQTLPSQTMTIAAKASADAAFDGVTIDTAIVKAAFLSVSMTGKLSLAQKQTLDKVISAHFQVDVPDVRTAMAMAAAFQTPTPVAPAKAGEAKAGTPKTAAEAAEDAPRVFTGGAVAIKGDVGHSGAATSVTTTAVIDQLAWTKGAVSYQAKKIDLALAATADATAVGKSLMDQIKQVKVTTLQGDLAGATLSMPTPIVVNNPGTAMTAAGAVKVTGKLADLAPLAAAWQGKPADAYPYRGDLDMTETVNSHEQTLSLKGKVAVDNFQSLDGQKVAFADKQFSVENDVDLVTVGTGETADQNVAVHTLAVAMQETKALNFTIANGTVNKLNTAREINLVAAVDIDWAKAWPAIQPLAGDSYKTAKMSGLWQRKLTVTGSYPAGKPFPEAVKTLDVDGSVVVGLFDHSGLVVKDLDLPFTVKAGKLVTGKPTGTTQATLNDGQLYTDALTVDLTQTPMRLSTPDNKVLLTHATINPLFTGTYLQQLVNNPAFVGVNQATGLLDLSFVHCDRLPAGALVTQNVLTNDGTATVKFSLTDLHIGSAFLTKALQYTGTSGSGVFVANVKDATVTLAHGVAQQDVTFQTGKYNLPFKGGVALATKQFQGYTVGLPAGEVARVLKAPPQVASAIGTDLPVPVNGALTSPQFDVPGAFAVKAQAALSNPGNLLGGLLNGNKGQPNNAAGGNGSGQPPAKEDPVQKGVQQGLDNLFGGKKKK